VARTRSRSVETNNGSSAVSGSDRRRRSRVVEAQDEAPRRERPAPSARAIRPRTAGATSLINRIPVVRSIAAYFRGVATEMAKVTWPSREDTVRLTTVVLAVTVAFSIGLGALSGFFSWWFQQAFHADSEAVFLLVAALVAVLAGGSYFALRHRI
jgi:preprotein translocase SecE subunit